MGAQSRLIVLRTKLGFTREEIAGEAGWSRKRLRKMEAADADLDVADALRLGDLYGVDIMEILDGRVLSGKFTPNATLLKSQADALPLPVRFEMTQALGVARDIKTLSTTLELPESPLSVTHFKEDRNLDHPKHGHPGVLAKRVRDYLECSSAVSSVLAQCKKLGVLVLSAKLLDPDLDGFCSFSLATGPVIIVNELLLGRPLAFRTTVAHELCHLFFDRKKMRSFNRFCETDGAKKEDKKLTGPLDEFAWVEQRARAFQVALLAPQDEVLAAWKKLSVSTQKNRDATLFKLSSMFGTGPLSVAWQLVNAGGRDWTAIRDTQGAMSAIGQEVSPMWSEDTEKLRAESRAATAADIRAAPSMPVLRQGLLFRMVKDAVLRGDLSESWARELLRISLAEWLALRAQWAV